MSTMKGKMILWESSGWSSLIAGCQGDWSLACVATECGSCVGQCLDSLSAFAWLLKTNTFCQRTHLLLDQKSQFQIEVTM